MAPLLADHSSLRAYLASLLTRSASPSPSPTPASTILSTLSQLAHEARSHPLLRRTVEEARGGVTSPDSIPNKVVFIMLGLIGASFVITGIWFFFWAKNGGFYFRQDDWDDYKSTVLRRKGPNGTTLSGATASTDFGGGSIVHGENGEKGSSRWGGRRKKGMKRYKDLDEEAGSQGTSSLGGSTLASEMGEARHGQVKKGKKGRKAAAAASEAGTALTGAEVDFEVQDAMRAYRHEKPARVGGLNKQPDGSSFGGSHTHDGSTATSELLSHREKTPTNTPTKGGKKERPDGAGGGPAGIRKVAPSMSEGSSNSFWSPSRRRPRTEEEDARIKAEAKKLQEKGRAAQRRDFSFRAGDDGDLAATSSSVGSSEVSDRHARRAERAERERRRRHQSRSPVKKVPGGFLDDDDEEEEEEIVDVGTKIYHHPIPGLGSSTGGSDYVDERRRKRNGGGYRRGRRDSLSE
ncbi:hypothetical protein MBM_00423 [Drepanopeziza brunnea f. sp. 'multigermtubi' MB_m1]|uniref:Endosomal spry domain-containing protein n=1 Tax=Marssonina brunnea f. sp. multigermtubi (strain MB_m1) TaxID=1072389 RepID=K1WUF7_MARBU|nr:uncharacterized protein MBM_00423 [Drepanopeziza brunnea f. sp. 'multigermtubi' MB_m1]EKD21310.1 hypothetical protein MBM_00423 [Drepanopeziza brunnea f. sp. 'multigermtubi' MB_m1]